MYGQAKLLALPPSPSPPSTAAAAAAPLPVIVPAKATSTEALDLRIDRVLQTSQNFADSDIFSGKAKWTKSTSPSFTLHRRHSRHSPYPSPRSVTPTSSSIDSIRSVGSEDIRDFEEHNGFSFKMERIRDEDEVEVLWNSGGSPAQPQPAANPVNHHPPPASSIHPRLRHKDQHVIHSGAAAAAAFSPFRTYPAAAAAAPPKPSKIDRPFLKAVVGNTLSNILAEKNRIARRLQAQAAVVAAAGHHRPSQLMQHQPLEEPQEPQPIPPPPPLRIRRKGTLLPDIDHRISAINNTLSFAQDHLNDHFWSGQQRHQSPQEPRPPPPPRIPSPSVSPPRIDARSADYFRDPRADAGSPIVQYYDSAVSPTASTMVYSPTSNPSGKRGRPRKHAPKIPLPPLYVFIRNMIHNLSYNPRIIGWVHEPTGVFKVNNTAEFARTWGLMKSNRSEEMNYEKMSRAMRYHYGSEKQGRKGHLAMVKEKRLVYKFGELAVNWRISEVVLTHCDVHDLCRGHLCLWTKE